MLKYILKYTYRAEDYRLDDTVSKVEWWFKKWGVDLFIETKRTRFSEMDEANYETRNDGMKSIAREKVADEWEPLNDGVILFVNKDDAIESVTLRGQQNRAIRNGVEFGVLEVYSQPHRYVYLREDRDGVWHYTGTTRERGSAFRQDVYVTIHEILHDIADILGIEDGLHKAIEENRFIEYAETLCKLYVTKGKLAEKVEELKEAKPVAVGAVFQNPPIKYIAIHHTAVSRASGKNQLEAVNEYHRTKNWGTASSPWYQSRPSSLGYYVGYNRFIDVDGDRTITRAIGEETIAQVGHNCDIFERCDTVSVCVAGDFNQELLNDDQIVALRTELRALQAQYPDAKLVFHSELQAGRTCAGKLFTHDYLKTRVLQEGIPEPDPQDQLKQEEIQKIMQSLSIIGQILETISKMLGLKR